MTAAATPGRQQYLDIKAEHSDAIVWFRLGDFYEMFDEDAHVASAALRITLTSRSFGKDCKVPMCGVPVHAYARFLARLVRQGYRVAVCEQLSPPGKGLVDRKVVRIVTAGTLSEPELLRPNESNYLAAVTRQAGRYAIAHADVSTGEFRVTETENAAEFVGELEALDPAECLIDPTAALPKFTVRCEKVDQLVWRKDTEERRLSRHLSGASTRLTGCEDSPAAAAAAGAILGYLDHTNRPLLESLRRLRPYTLNEAVAIDPGTRATLLGRGRPSADREVTLLSLLDHTVTPMGARLLARRLRNPTRNAAELTTRLDAVEELAGNPERRASVQQAMRRIGDLERLIVRVGQDRASAAELLALVAALEATLAVIESLVGAAAPAIIEAGAELDPAPDIAAAIRAAVAEPGSERLIRPGFDAGLDGLAMRSVAARGRLADLERDERERTGIRSLKVAYNSVFGYFIEVSKSNLSKIPADFTRKQTLVNAERFVTAELLRWEAELAEAEAQLQVADAERFSRLLHDISGEASRLQQTASALARLDVTAALAEAADLRGYTRPELHEGTELVIQGGRHPLVEAALGPEAFIPNDCRLGGDGPVLAVVTGPNMGGKSTYLRQTALIVYMAQIGSFVPARLARVGLVDRIFTRVGAHDHLARGQSSFLVEMAETAAIARLASSRSLVLLDEIGRGTTSIDGQAIAHAVAEYLHDVLRARTLFATHYYELARAAESWPCACNLHVAAEEHGEDVVFLYSVAPGTADKSFALQVARMAGMPEQIVRRAEDLVSARNAHPPAYLEQDAQLPDIRPPIRLNVAEGARETSLAEALLVLDLASTTPIAALNALHELQRHARLVRQDSADGRRSRPLTYRPL
jgi:DNA mismatch repair protein MutS